MANLVRLEKRLRRPRLVIATVLAMIVGALLGGLAFGLKAPDRTVTAFIRITQPADLAAVAGGADYSTPDAQPVTESYVAGEVAYLSGEGFAQAVSVQAGDIDVFAEQAGGSGVVEFSAAAKDGDAAAAAVQTAIDVYGQTLKERADRQLSTVLPTLDRWQSEARDPIRTGEIVRLRETIRVQGQNAAAVTVLQEPTIDDDVLGEWMTGAAAGALIMGGGEAWLLLGRRRRPPTLVAQVAGVIHHVLIPAIDLRQPAPTSWGVAQVALARTLAAQFGVARDDRVIVAIGVEPHSGTDVIAAMLEVGAADRRAQGAPTHTVVDAGPVGTTALAESEIGQATHIVVVVRIDVDQAEHVLPVLSAAASYGVPTFAAFTFRPWWQSLLPRRRTAAPARGGHRRRS